mgnify:CR=1 FL=1
MKLITAIAIIGMSVTSAIAQSTTPDGRPINPEGIADPAGRPINPEGIGQRTSYRQPGYINPADDPFGILRDPAGRPIKPDGIGERSEEEKRGS